MVILDLTVLHTGERVGQKIGAPEHLTEVSVQKKTEPAPAASYKPTNSNGFGSTSRANESLSPMNGTKDHLTFPISNLSPYQNKWVIKARVTSKGAIRHWSNAKGEGKLFSMDLMDESGEIRATAFNDAVDKFYEMIQVGFEMFHPFDAMLHLFFFKSTLQVDKVYFISKCVLKSANKQYSSIKNDYEISFSNDTVVEECLTANDNVPNVSYNLVPLSQISQMEANATVGKFFE